MKKQSVLIFQKKRHETQAIIYNLVYKLFSLYKLYYYIINFLCMGHINSLITEEIYGYIRIRYTRIYRQNVRIEDTKH